MFFHGLQQRALCFWRGAIDFVSEDELGEHRSRMKFEGARLAVENRHTDDVGRQHIAGELDTMKIEPKRFGEDVRERGLADAGHVFDQQVSACQHAGERKADLWFLAKNYLAHLRNDARYRRSHGSGFGLGVHKFK